MEKNDKFSLRKIQEAEELAEKDRQAAKEAYAQIQRVAAFLEGVKGASREASERLKPEISEAKQILTANIYHENTSVRRSVWKALLGFYFNTPLEVQDEVEQLVNGLVGQKNLLYADPNGALVVYGTSYSVSKDSMFEEEDTKEVKRELEALIGRVRRIIRTRAALTAEELLRGNKDGSYYGYVPPQKFLDGEGNASWRPGGTIAVTCERGWIKLIDATGKIEGPIMKAKKLEVKITSRSLAESRPPFLKNVPEEIARATQLFWHILKRAVIFANWLESVKTRTTITPYEFLVEKKDGVTFLDFEEPWEEIHANEEAFWISRPLVLIQRFQREGKKFVQLLETAEHLTDWLGECWGEFPEEGNRFEGLPQLLQRFLQAMYGKEVKAGKNGKKALAES